MPRDYIFAEMQIEHVRGVCRASIAEIRQHRWVARDYKPCRQMQSVASTDLADYIFEENVQPQYISQVCCWGLSTGLLSRVMHSV